ncbi:B-cell receptor CD22-like [Halichoeres trimaculatus]|uniref:B-cell receptor CD22-like n=1 Tax=Halichoeres trimaculatus TaxID=147232 RepID=UPI003D9EE401
MKVMSFQSMNLVSASMFLLVFFVSGALADDCPRKSALFISAPQRIEALSGSCLQISCNFSSKDETEFDSKRETFGLWIKETTIENQPRNVVFNSSGSVVKYPISIPENLKEKNCTTLFSNLKTTFTGIYYFRIMNWPYRATAVCDPLGITVKDSPPSPRIEISGDLKENQSVTVTCSALTPCPRWPPKLTWNLQKDSHNLMEQNTDGSFTTKIQKNITLSEQHDGYNISCSASYPVNEGEEKKTAEETKTLRVSYAPKNTSVSISPSGLVSAGTKVNLSCSSRAKPPVSSFTWFKISNNKPPMMVSEGEFYSFNVTTDGVYYCEARNEVGHQKSSRIHLRIGEHSDLSLLWGSAIGGIIVISLICLASQRDDELTQQPADESEETIHYGEINFSVRRPELHSVLVQDCGLGQDSLYAQVKASKPARSRTQPDDSPQTLYATVKKKSC